MGTISDTFNYREIRYEEIQPSGEEEECLCQQAADHERIAVKVDIYLTKSCDWSTVIGPL